MDGDGLRSLALPESDGGYIKSDVDELLLRIAGEMDAGRPVADLVANAVLWRPKPTVRQALLGGRPCAYDVAAVQWLLRQLRSCDDGRERARLEADPWRDLDAWDFSERTADAGPAGVYADAWLAWGGLPGTRLRWVRTGALGSELRAEGGQVSASVRLRRPWLGHPGQAAVVRVGGRDFTSQRASGFAWPGNTATFGTGCPATGDLAGNGTDRLARVLADQSGLPVLCTGGRHFSYLAGAYIRLSGGRWFQFPVRGRSAGSAVMTALDQDGNKVALYRMAAAGGRLPSPRQVEIAVHPDQAITDELLVILAVSAPWVWTYFVPATGGGG